MDIAGSCHTTSSIDNRQSAIGNACPFPARFAKFAKLVGGAQPPM
jgi:hypothetical protein